MSTTKTVRFFLDKKTGIEPVRQWLIELRDSASRSRIDTYLLRLESGNFGSSKSLGEGLFELKIPIGPGFRIYYMFEGPHILLLLMAGDKSSQTKDILKARDYLNEHKGRKHGNR